MDIVGWILGVLGLGLGVFGEMRARRAERRAEQDSKNLEIVVSWVKQQGGVIKMNEHGDIVAVTLSGEAQAGPATSSGQLEVGNQD